MFGASFFTFIWMAWGVVTVVSVVLMIWKCVTGVPEENFVILDAARGGPSANIRPLLREPSVWRGWRNTAGSPH